MNLYVLTSTSLDDSERGSGEQADWREDWSFSVNSVHCQEPAFTHISECETFAIDAEIKAGDPVHLLVIRWDDGDSYGHSYGHGEVLWVFKDPLLAQEALKRWEYANDFHGDWRHDNKQQHASFRVDGGATRQLSNPAFSYFCRVTSLRLVTMIVQF